MVRTYRLPSTIINLAQNEVTQVGLVILLFSLLVVPTIGRLGTGWDEFTDLLIARSYVETPGGWLIGSQFDIIQSRLSIAITAFLAEIFNRLSVVFARSITIGVACLTLVGVYVFCRMKFDHKRGMLAIALLATSPFFLAFARGAFSESDIFTACGLVWLLVCAGAYEERPTLGRVLWMAVVMGLGMAVKFTLIVVMPAVWLAIWQARTPKERLANRRVDLSLLACGLWIIGCTAGSIWLAGSIPFAEITLTFRLYLYLGALTGWLIAVAWIWYYGGTRPSWGVQILVFTAMASLTFLIFPPEHLTNPKIITSLFSATESKWDAASVLAMAWETIATHVLCVWIKSSPIIGLGLLFGFVLTLLEWKRTKVRTALLAVILYSGSLLYLLYIQTFYTITLLPVLAIFAADWFFRLFERRRTVALGIAAAAVIVLAYDLFLCYPDFQLNGYQWVGARMLAGRKSISYTSVVHTPSDGIEQAVSWVRHRYEDSDKHVYIFGRPEQLILTTAGPELSRRITLFYRDKDPSPDQADIIIIHINDNVLEGAGVRLKEANPILAASTYDVNWLHKNYRRVYAVKRAFNFVVASVWIRK